MSEGRNRGVKTVDEVFAHSSIVDFENGMNAFIMEKFVARKPLTKSEETLALLYRIEPSMYSNGFVDLFYQEFSLLETKKVIEALEALGFLEAAKLFNEAKEIYVGHNRNITEEEYGRRDPFRMETSPGLRFDEIGEVFGNTLNLVGGGKVYEFAKRNRDDFI